jgi:GT2 family glycosyltransferase
MNRVDLAILIVSYNTKPELANCLESLFRHPPQVSHEIVVIDNASQDGSAGMVRSEWPSARVIALDENVGFARANNEGFQQTTSDLVLLLNSDTLVPAGAVDGLVKAMSELPGAAIVGPKLVDGAGRPELSYGKMIGPFAELRQKALVRFAGANALAALTSRTRATDWVTAACLLVRRQHAERAGFLDVRYFMYLEDVDF